MVRLLVTVLSLLTSAAALQAADNPDPWAGTWINVDTEHGGVTKLLIAEGKLGRTIQAWGRCRPTDCDWGATPLAMFGYGTPYRFATWDPKFKDTYMILRPEKDEIAAEIFYVYKDGSRRPNYRVEYRFKRPAE
jgi:hypothetical protein